MQENFLVIHIAGRGNFAQNSWIPNKLNDHLDEATLLNVRLTSLKTIHTILLRPSLVGISRSTQKLISSSNLWKRRILLLFIVLKVKEQLVVLFVTSNIIIINYTFNKLITFHKIINNCSFTLNTTNNNSILSFHVFDEDINFI